MELDAPSPPSAADVTKTIDNKLLSMLKHGTHWKTDRKTDQKTDWVSMR